MIKEIADVLTLILSTFTGISFLAFLGWPIELLVHFKAQYALGALTLMVYHFFAGDRKRIGLTFFVAAINMGALVNLSKAEDLSRLNSPYTLLSYNVHFKRPDMLAFKTYVKELKPNWIILSEVTQKHQTEISDLETDYPYQKWEVHRGPNGMAFLSQTPWKSFEFQKTPKAPSVVVSTFDLHGRELTIVGIHTLSPVTFFRAGSRDTQLRGLGQWLRKNSQDFVVAGDLNATPWSPIIKEFKQLAGGVDPTISIFPEVSWPSDFPLFWIPIDHFFHSAGLVASKKIGPFLGSDHYPLIATFGFPTE